MSFKAMSTSGTLLMGVVGDDLDLRNRERERPALLLALQLCQSTL